MNVPTDRRYTEHDEWFLTEGDLLVIGITDFAQDALGDLVHVELPDVGKKLSNGDVACEVESVKAVAEVYSPVDGTIAEVNAAVGDDAEIVNRDPYGAGWILKIRVAPGTDLSHLLDAGAYGRKIGG